MSAWASLQRGPWTPFRQEQFGIRLLAIEAEARDGLDVGPIPQPDPDASVFDQAQAIIAHSEQEIFDHGALWNNAAARDGRDERGMQALSTGEEPPGGGRDEALRAALREQLRSYTDLSNGSIHIDEPGDVDGFLNALLGVDGWDEWWQARAALAAPSSPALDIPDFGDKEPVLYPFAKALSLMRRVEKAISKDYHHHDLHAAIVEWLAAYEGEEGT